MQKDKLALKIETEQMSRMAVALMNAPFRWQTLLGMYIVFGSEQGDLTIMPEGSVHATFDHQLPEGRVTEVQFLRLMNED